MIVFKKINFYKLLFLLLLIILPFSMSNYSDNVQPEKITSDLRFYEINTCSISLNEFILKNPNVIYQDHYKIRFNNYSSLSCFGQITGIDQVGHTFFISIGTNTVANLFIQSLIWIIMISFIKNDKTFKFHYTKFFYSLISSLLICILIYSESRYYEKSFFLIDLSVYGAYKYLFVYLLFICFFGLLIIDSRQNSMINYLPYMFLFIGVFSGTNFYFWTIPFLAKGLQILLTKQKVRRIFSILNLINLLWAYQALGENYFLKPDKIRGLTLSSYNFLTVSIWSYVVFISFIGIFFFIKNNTKYINYSLLNRNFLMSGSSILLLGYLGSNNPYIMFFNYYFFGQNKFGTNNQYLFQKNEWGETLAWRGFFPSAETIGEFFAISLLLFVVIQIKSKIEWKPYFVFVPFSIFGLYLSNNKAASFGLMISIFLIVLKNFKINKFLKYIFIVFSVGILIYFVRFENLLFSFSYTGDKIYEMAGIYGRDYERSSAFKLLSSLKDNSSIFYGFLALVSQIAFFINRSELWGLFVARYNPNSLEFFFGTGPYSLSNHYSEINVSPYRVNTGDQLGFLLPHSSLLLSLIFFGFVGIILGLIVYIYKLLKLRKINYEIFVISSFIFINLMKSDSLLYLPAVFCYLLFLSLGEHKIKKE